LTTTTTPLTLAQVKSPWNQAPLTIPKILMKYNVASLLCKYILFHLNNLWTFF
jgi:hypothetical protein